MRPPPLYRVCNMGKLQGMRVYLAGPMDECNDQGALWREALTPYLHTLGLKVFNPLDKPIERGRELEMMERRRQCKREGRYDELAAIMREISNVDLRMVDICDFLIAHQNKEIYSIGTLHEIALANSQKKPVLLHMQQGKHSVSDWWYGRLDHNEFFSTWEQLKEYLWKIDCEKIEPSKRWYFFNKEVLL